MATEYISLVARPGYRLRDFARRSCGCTYRLTSTDEVIVQDCPAVRMLTGAG